MSNKTIIKVLKRYAKGLKVMEIESECADKEHYNFDRNVFEQAIKIIERSNTES